MLQKCSLTGGNFPETQPIRVPGPPSNQTNIILQGRSSSDPFASSGGSSPSTILEEVEEGEVTHSENSGEQQGPEELVRSIPFDRIDLFLTQEDPSSGILLAWANVQLLEDDHAVVDDSWKNALVWFIVGKPPCNEAVSYSLSKA